MILRTGHSNSTSVPDGRSALVLRFGACQVIAFKRYAGSGVQLPPEVPLKVGPVQKLMLNSAKQR